MVGSLETIGIAPKGSTKVSKVLSLTADDLVEGGVQEVFTPSYYFCARKPIMVSSHSLNEGDDVSFNQMSMAA